MIVIDNAESDQSSIPCDSVTRGIKTKDSMDYKQQEKTTGQIPPSKIKGGQSSISHHSVGSKSDQSGIPRDSMLTEERKKQKT